MKQERNQLRRALLEAAEREFAALPPREVLEAAYPVSPGFQAGMDRIVRQTKRRYLQIGRHAVRRAAAAVVALLLLLCGCMAVPAVRTLVAETCQGLLSYCFSPDQESARDRRPMVLEFPEGFHLKEYGPAIRYLQLILETDEGEELELVRATQGMTLLIGDESVPAESCVIGGHPCLRHSADGVNTIVWTDGAYAYRIRGSCEMAVLERFVELYEPDP